MTRRTWERVYKVSPTWYDEPSCDTCRYAVVSAQKKPPYRKRYSCTLMAEDDVPESDCFVNEDIYCGAHE
jgi:hypothetical protein